MRKSFVFSLTFVFALILIVTVSNPASAQLSESVHWTNAVNVSVDGNNLKKNHEQQEWDAGAVSVNTITSGNAYIETTITDSTKFVMIGFSKGDTDQFWKDIDFPIQIMNKGKLTIYRIGESISFPRDTYMIGDVLRIEINGSDLEYKINGKMIHVLEGVIDESNYPLSVDTSMRLIGTTLNDVKIGVISEDPIEKLEVQIDDMVVLFQQLSDRLSALEQKIDEQQSIISKLGSGVPVDCSQRGPGIDLRHCDLSFTDLTDANLTDANLTDANLRGVTIKDVDQLVTKTIRCIGQSFCN